MLALDVYRFSMSFEFVLFLVSCVNLDSKCSNIVFIKKATPSYTVARCILTKSIARPISLIIRGDADASMSNATRTLFDMRFFSSSRSVILELQSGSI